MQLLSLWFVPFKIERKNLVLGNLENVELSCRCQHQYIFRQLCNWHCWWSDYREAVRPAKSPGEGNAIFSSWEDCQHVGVQRALTFIYITERTQSIHSFPLQLVSKVLPWYGVKSSSQSCLFTSWMVSVARCSAKSWRAYVWARPTCTPAVGERLKVASDVSASMLESHSKALLQLLASQLDVISLHSSWPVSFELLW